MLATYVDQIVAEERMAEIEWEAARLRRQSQQPDRERTAFTPRAQSTELGRETTGTHATATTRHEPGLQDAEVLS